MPLPPGDAVRPAARADLPELVRLYRASDAVDVGAVDSDDEEILWRWRTDGFDLSSDTRVVERAGGLVAYGWVFEGLADVRVDPAARGQGIGAHLLALSETRAAEQGSRDGMIRQNVTSRNPAARALLEAAGYTESHHYARMEIELASRPGVPDAPPGVAVRPYEPGRDEAAAHAAFNRAWAQYEGDRWAPEPLERFLEHTEADTFDPATWHLAEEDGAIVAFSLCDQYPDLGWVQYLGTVPEARGRGLGRLLLLHSFATYWDRGVRRVGLTVSSSNLPAARALYESAGMREVLRYDNLRKPLSDVVAGR
ncbi:MAG TPA: GNAT family N-acetyltransferase [Actinomycetota bacterium]|nr:GNAT family N-acetyltransferase [Actinomycetota bacterium]